VRSRLAHGDPLIALGTHALFQQDVEFGRLGLVIVDEQHRFGVHQRLALLEKGTAGAACPHQLIMTATPIPRTLAMTVFADLDVSIIDELPPGRPPVRTHVISGARRTEIVRRIEIACAAGRQAYWVCPLIEESEALQCRAAVETQRALTEALPGRRIGLLHGRMKPAEKEREMRAFKGGGTDVLVATTVIEVGVDVPNASLMIVENAERLGLSQLHQLRGRVGRGSRESDCVLMYQPPLGETARARLETMRHTTDGFRIAEKDLELRGPGELLGARQTGMQSMRVANLARDQRMIPQVQRAAEALLRYHPDLVESLIRRWVTVDSNLGAV
jgi:ATP-dependent DNA helicase RecG